MSALTIPTNSIIAEKNTTKVPAKTKLVRRWVPIHQGYPKLVAQWVIVESN